MHYFGELDDVAPGFTLSRLTSKHIEEWVKNLAAQKGNEYDPATVEKCLRGVRMRIRINIADPNSNIL